MIKLTDYIFKRLTEVYGVNHVFLITGGGAMHLNDSIAKNKLLTYTCNHHEQASAIAAEGYTRSSGKLGVVNVTTGPGGLNTLTGVMGQWTDSVPVLYLSGQVKQSTTISAYPDIPLRQLGDQEVDIISVVKPLTKFAVQVTQANRIKYHLDQAIHMATSGRPGPVWLDIPMDIQGSLIDETELEEFYPEIEQTRSITTEINETINLLQQAQRPVIIAGNGIKTAKEQHAFKQLLEVLKVPVVTTFNGMDIIPENHPLFAGRIGTLGSRAGNFALQNADVVLCLGSRNNIRQISYNWEYFARAGKLILVDIDSAELNKPTIQPYLKINTGLQQFIPEILNCFSKNPLSRTEWLEWCKIRQQKYPTVLPEFHQEQQAVQPYVFVEQLSRQIPSDSIVVCGNGTACVVAFQAAQVQEGQQYIWNSGCASMGYDLPAAIGAAIANPEKPVFCLAGDGSLMMNLQELETMQYLKLNLKLIVLDNEGYISIKQTQESFFEGREIGSGNRSGVGFPNFAKVAQAFGLKTIQIDRHEDIPGKIEEMVQTQEPLVCVVKLTNDYKFIPKVSSEKRPDGRMISKPLEDLYPFLPREEFYKNMIIDPLND